MHGNLALSHPKTDELSHMNWGIPARLLLWCVWIIGRETFENFQAKQKIVNQNQTPIFASIRFPEKTHGGKFSLEKPLTDKVSHVFFFTRQSSVEFKEESLKNSVRK